MSAAAAAANQMVMSALKFTYLFQETYEQTAKSHKKSVCATSAELPRELYAVFLIKILDDLIL